MSSSFPLDRWSALDAHARRLIASYSLWTGRRLIEYDPSAGDVARTLFHAEFAVVSHGTEPDPIFNFANRVALDLFEMSWEEFTRLPARMSADEAERKERSALMEKVARDGFVTGYQGIRVSATGRRFMIADTTIWEVIDKTGHGFGRAARFDRWWAVE